jgi:hypothetical protein
LKKTFHSAVGILLIVAALAGIIISSAGIAGIWKVKEIAQVRLSETIDILDSTLDATTAALSVASDSLNSALVSIDTLSMTFVASQKSLSDTVPLIDTFAVMSGEELPESIKATQGAMQSAQASAGIVDNTLGLLSKIAFLGIPAYDPPVPLSEAFGNISDSLDPLVVSLSSVQQPLMDAKSNLNQMETQFTMISANIDGIHASISSAGGVIDQYQGVLAQLKQQTTGMRQSIPATLNAVAWFFTIFFIWLGLTQVGLLMQGAEMLGLEFDRRSKPESPKPQETQPTSQPVA